jgi:hypothetical protein
VSICSWIETKATPRVRNSSREATRSVIDRLNRSKRHTTTPSTSLRRTEVMS